MKTHNIRMRISIIVLSLETSVYPINSTKLIYNIAIIKQLYAVFFPEIKYCIIIYK